jgi:prophage regulatory protein
MPDKFLRAAAVTALTGLSRTSLWRSERVGDFHKRRQLGANSVAWLESEVLGWMQSRPIVQGGAAPGHGRGD